MILTPNEIAYLSASFKGENPLSLFSNITKSPEGNEYKTLSDKGIIVNNAYEAKALDLLMLLTKPEKCSRLIIQNPFFVTEKYTYKTGNRLVLAENNKGAFEISEMADLTQLILSVSEFVSMSKIKTTDITELFSPDELIVLLAVIDIYRKRTLGGYIGSGENEIKLTEEEISAELADGFANGLAKSVINNYKLKRLQIGTLGGLIASLVKKGCIKAGAEIELTPVWAVFAKNFLIPETILLYEMFELDTDGKMMAESTLAITAGIHDIFSLTFDRETFKFETLAAAELIRAVEATLECPSFEKATPSPAQATPTAAPAPAAGGARMAPPPAAVRPAAPAQPGAAQPAADGSWKCKCGTVNKGNFCVNCGSRKS
jgi:hypothetical protein